MDRFEGKLTQATREFFGETIGNSEQLFEKLETLTELVYAHCWHKNPVENYLMWGAYTSHPDSIAIKTTFGNLKKEFDSSIERLNYKAGSGTGSLFKGGFFDVQYVNETHLDHTYSFYQYFSTKRKYYEGEQECRFLVEIKTPSLNKPHTLPFLGLNSLDFIDEIVLNPKRSAALEQSIKKVLPQNLALKVKESIFRSD